jgi:hypothetical protein
VTVAELQTPAPLRNPVGASWCERFGEERAGQRSAAAGAFMRVGVSPDGSVVVFEVTDDFPVYPHAFPPPVEEGIYRVGADGRGLRRLGAPSRAASFRVGFASSDVLYRFSPNGRMIVFTDCGPGPAGEDALQVATLDVTTGRRTLVTRLSASEDECRGGPVQAARFAGDDTIVFFRDPDPDGEYPDGGWFRVQIDGSGLEAATTPVATPDSRVRPTFDIAGGGTNLLAMQVAGTSVDFWGKTLGNDPREMFVLDGKKLLQLTSFHRSDTGFGGKVLDRRAGRGYFTASADPLGENPSEHCQIFSIDTLGTRLRQLTHFRDRDRTDAGCGFNDPYIPGCTIGPVYQDEVTKTIVFYSSCDPFGSGIYGGQVFSMRPDGTGLRQLTTLRGLVREADGAVSVELPGPVAYSAPDGGRALY